MTTVPVKTIETSKQFTSWRHYPLAVNKPAARIFGYSLTACFGLFESVALLLAFMRGATLADALYWYAIAATLALAVGGFAGWQSFIFLHDEYMELSERRDVITSTDYGQLSRQARGIPLNESSQIIINRPAKTINGVLFRGDWLEKMYATLQDGNQRLTRNTSGISGSAYADCVRVLQQSGYVDASYNWTEQGKEWLSQT